jgi:hypothetical protein
MVLRGFLLLHRDAAAGRFSAQRAGGGSFHRNAVGGDNTDSIPVPPTVRFVEALPSNSKPSLLDIMARKLIGSTDEMEQKIVPYSGVPPPSDYFLGFSSPGTQVSNLSSLRLEYEIEMLTFHVCVLTFICRSGVD